MSVEIKGKIRVNMRGEFARDIGRVYNVQYVQEVKMVILIVIVRGFHPSDVQENSMILPPSVLN